MRAADFALVALACGAAKVGSRPAAVGVRWAPGVATALDAAATAAGQQDLPQQPEDASGHAAPGASPDSACSVSQSGNVPADPTAQAPQCQANGTRSCRTFSPPMRGAASLRRSSRCRRRSCTACLSKYNLNREGWPPSRATPPCAASSARPHRCTLSARYSPTAGWASSR